LKHDGTHSSSECDEIPSENFNGTQDPASSKNG
jgi:hypothetical protein